MSKTGTVLRWNSNRGFGFAKVDDDPSTEVLIHRDQILAFGRRELPPGMEVEFTVEERQGKFYARQVTAKGGLPLELNQTSRRSPSRNRGKGPYSRPSRTQKKHDRWDSRSPDRERPQSDDFLKQIGMEVIKRGLFASSSPSPPPSLPQGLLSPSGFPSHSGYVIPGAPAHQGPPAMEFKLPNGVPIAIHTWQALTHSQQQALLNPGSCTPAQACSTPIPPIEPSANDCPLDLPPDPCVLTAAESHPDLFQPLLLLTITSFHFFICPFTLWASLNHNFHPITPPLIFLKSALASLSPPSPPPEPEPEPSFFFCKRVPSLFSGTPGPLREILRTCPKFTKNPWVPSPPKTGPRPSAAGQKPLPEFSSPIMRTARPPPR